MSEFTAVGPALNLDGPLPREPEYSLLNTLRALARDVEDGPSPLSVVDSNNRVFNGVNVWGYPVDAPSLWEPCASGTYRDKVSDTDWDQPRFDGLIAYFPITCSTITASPDTFAARAEAALKAKLSFAVEEALAKGVTGSTNPFLGDTNLTQLGGGTVTAQAGLNYLENAIGETGTQGMILATPGTVSAWNFVNLITDENEEGYAETANGTPVASCGGLINTDPVGKTGSTPTTGIEWAFAVGPVQVYLGMLDPPSVSEYVDRENNVITYFAERPILPLWDTSLQSGVLIDWTP
jgi:hypothetical protein